MRRRTKGGGEEAREAGEAAPGCGRPAAARGKKGGGGRRKGTSPTGGPHLSARGRERRGEAALVGRCGPIADVGRAEKKEKGGGR
jgi:hypothetical protein